MYNVVFVFFFFQAEDGIRDWSVTGVRRVLFRSSDTMNDFKNLKKINVEIEKAELRKHRLQNLDRKERAHRLIRKGAMLEKYFECEHLSSAETEELLKMYSKYINTNKPNKFKKK